MNASPTASPALTERQPGPFGDTRLDSPIRPLRLIASPRGLAEIVFLADDPDPAHARLHHSDAELLAPVAPVGELDQRDPIRAYLALAAAELCRYFAGELREFTVPLDFVLSSGFYLEARRAMREIPYGEVATYGEVAEIAGRPGAARAVGTACARNPIPIIVPCHRVVLASGGIGSYGGGQWMKERLLALEGAHLPR